MKWAILKKHIVEPALRRVGFALAAALGAQGFPPELLEQVAQVVIMLGLVIMDLVTSWQDRVKRAK
jgi:hypothetical protein